jgi:DNA-binding transcriptional LysR family regulator
MSSFPPLRKLHYVLAVARELHFRKAAERLHTSQPSLSRQIRELEEEIGFEIFYRKRHVVALTEAGKSFIVVVNDMLSRIDADFRRAKDTARQASRQSSACFVIGHSPLVPADLRPQFRSVQRRKFVYLSLQFRNYFAPELIDAISSGAIQAGVTFAPVGRCDLEQMQFGTDRLCAVTAKNSSLVGGPAAELESLKLHPLILAGSERAHPFLYQSLLQQCAAKGFRPTIAEEVTHPMEAFDLVRNSVGVAILPFGACAQAPDDMQYFPICGVDFLSLVFLYRHKDTMAREILEELADRLRENGFQFAS